jgi:hypothetical protein
MRRVCCGLLLGFFAVTAWAGPASDGRILKVLPQFLDRTNQHTVSPSLYDRDAYQAWLRVHTNEVSGVRFAVEYKARGDRPLKLRVEVRGVPHGALANRTTLEADVKPSGWFSRWTTSLRIVGDDYRTMGSVVAWRATLWDGDRLLGEQKSFLW